MVVGRGGRGGLTEANDFMVTIEFIKGGCDVGDSSIGNGREGAGGRTAKLFSSKRTTGSACALASLI